MRLAAPETSWKHPVLKHSQRGAQGVRKQSTYGMRGTVAGVVFTKEDGQTVACQFPASAEDNADEREEPKLPRSQVTGSASSGLIADLEGDVSWHGVTYLATARRSFFRYQSIYLSSSVSQRSTLCKDRELFII